MRKEGLVDDKQRAGVCTCCVHKELRFGGAGLCRLTVQFLNRQFMIHSC